MTAQRKVATPKSMRRRGVEFPRAIVHTLCANLLTVSAVVDILARLLLRVAVELAYSADRAFRVYARSGDSGFRLRFVFHRARDAYVVVASGLAPVAFGFAPDPSKLASVGTGFFAVGPGCIILCSTIP